MSDAPTPSPAPPPGYLLERFRAWRAASFADSRASYARLAEEGQRPRAMLIACCDSRIDPVAMFAAGPGDLFVARNVANLVPPHAPEGPCHEIPAAAEFAVTGLRVAHILVLGHSGCGGVAACHDMCSGGAPALEAMASYVGRWMDILRPGYERVADLPGGRADRLRALEHEAVRVSLANLAGYPFVAEAMAAGRLSLHGAWIDIAKGELSQLDPETGAFMAV